uniref:Uncharacterized protein n=1 Tax=Parascaris univalens TaxID=6257 RepID=A0A915AAD3_PARUN
MITVVFNDVFETAVRCVRLLGTSDFGVGCFDSILFGDTAHVLLLLQEVLRQRQTFAFAKGVGQFFEIHSPHRRKGTNARGGNFHEKAVKCSLRTRNASKAIHRLLLLSDVFLGCLYDRIACVYVYTHKCECANFSTRFNVMFIYF